MVRLTTTDVVTSTFHILVVVSPCRIFSDLTLETQTGLFNFILTLAPYSSEDCKPSIEILLVNLS